MRKLIVSMNLSLEGYMSDSQGGLDWHFEKWNEDMGEKLLELMERTDTILLGSITYDAMARYWSVIPHLENFPRQDLAIADRMERHRKFVFSKTARTAFWNNTLFTAAGVEKEITKLKQNKGKDIVLFGSGAVVSACIKFRLADEYWLWVHPVLLGNGKPLFENLDERIRLTMKGSFLFESGVYLLIYEPCFSSNTNAPRLNREAKVAEG
jgi:dihydrofolate reductase